jgi:transposase
MNYIEQEESFTSKASFLDNDDIPVFNPYQPDIQYIFSGKRIERGLYRSKSGAKFNADVNGACNIIRKSKQNFNLEKLCIGLVASPERIRLD